MTTHATTKTTAGSAAKREAKRAWNANPTAAKAVKLVRRIRANTEALYAGKIDDETFHARQIAAWDAVTAAGPRVNDRVLLILREALPGAR